MKLKKKKKYKIFIILLILIISFLLSFSLTIKLYYTYNEDMYKYIISNNYHYHKKDKIMTNIISFILNIDLSKSISFLNNNYIKEDNQTSSDDDIDINSIEVIKQVNDQEDIIIDNPIVYLYNTHQKEEYALSSNSEYDIKPTVLTASYIIREKLNKNNIETIVEENDIIGYLKKQNWKYALSYNVSRMYMEEAKKNNESLIYYIDIHRDSVKKSISTVNINGKNYAKILFIVGLENKNYKENLELTEELNNMFKEKYPNISRGIYKKEGPGVNGVYNQDFSNKTILIEVGGQDNTIDEVSNTCDAISDVLTEYIRSQDNEK